MPIRLNRFEMPKRVVKDEETATDTYAKYVAEPFEIGYARTIGNSLRRVLLSSIEGVAIVSVRIKGADHEFCALPGVVEDVSDIIINLKKVLLKAYTREPGNVTISAKGPGVLTAASIESSDGSVEVVNPDQIIATLADDGDIEMELELQIGRGFHHVNIDAIKDDEIGRIAIDALYSPVTRVNFGTSMTRVGQKTDYDKLELEIWTDGRVSPDNALTIAAAIQRHHMDVFVGYDYEIIESDEVENTVDTEREDLRAKLKMSVNEIELSVRAANCLNNANITTVGELAQKTEGDMLKYRNFGKKSLNEIRDKLVDLGLGLGMSFDADLLTPVNNASAIEEQGE
ncbi:MAG: DNA-directed RNA polymerase subunit alpha [Kiritimatiellae bacterium]|nr:DNA-directed RNA polymerase subunit alpha [Kiritimatiellia bacterium]